MDIEFTFNIAPHMLEQVLSSGIVIALLVALAFVVKKSMGD